MPELPEVQTIANDLSQAGLFNIPIKQVDIHNPSTIATPSIAKFRDALINNSIISISRRGKWLIFTLKKGFVVIHLRMTGRFDISTNSEVTKHEHVVIEFADGRKLRFHDTRKFGRWYYVNDPDVVVGNLGPEPLTWNKRDFTIALKSKNRQLKPLLLDQEFIAGLGNIYVDEALWEAQLHPVTPSGQVTDRQAALLFEGIQKVLKRGIETSGTSLGKGKSNYYRLEGSQGEHQTKLNVFRQTGKPCPRCGAKIKRIVVGQRSTHFCPDCQQVNYLSSKLF